VCAHAAITTGACAPAPPPACTPGQRDCINGQQATCNATQTGFTLTRVCNGDNIVHTCEKAGTAIAIANLICDDGDACTTDSCNPNQTGDCLFVNNPVRGCPCNPGGVCTAPAVCNGTTNTCIFLQ